MLFPVEARLAMQAANADSTSVCTDLLTSKGSSGNLREVDLNETPSVQTKRLHSRLHALIKTGIINLISGVGWGELFSPPFLPF
jgi:regulatory protein NPR1